MHAAAQPPLDCCNSLQLFRGDQLGGKLRSRSRRAGNHPSNRAERDGLPARAARRAGAEATGNPRAPLRGAQLCRRLCHSDANCAPQSLKALRHSPEGDGWGFKPVVERAGYLPVMGTRGGCRHEAMAGHLSPWGHGRATGVPRKSPLVSLRFIQRIHVQASESTIVAEVCGVDRSGQRGVAVDREPGRRPVGR